MSTFEERVEQGLQLERVENYAAAIDHFRQLVEDFPEDARAHFEYAGAFDSAGQEAEAVPHYYRALEMGLPEDYRPRLFVQLGSSLRNIGQYEEAVHLLTRACEIYPDHVALHVFRALALESAGQAHEALSTLFDVVIEQVRTADMQRYARAIRYYVDERR